jgi:hypothetical protein
MPSDSAIHRPVTGHRHDGVRHPCSPQRTSGVYQRVSYSPCLHALVRLLVALLCAPWTPHTSIIATSGKLAALTINRSADGSIVMLPDHNTAQI